jgi:hypothetical protein
LCRLFKKAHVVILRSQGDEESLVVCLRFFAEPALRLFTSFRVTTEGLRMTDLLRGEFQRSVVDLSHFVTEYHLTYV